MSDYGRYGSDTYETRNRNRGRSRDFGGSGRGRGEDSIFNYGGSRERGRESGYRQHRDNRPGGWIGSGRTSDYDDDRSGSRGRRSERGYDYGSDDYREGLPIEETNRLIASNKVEGTPVYNFDGDRLGTIYNFMVDKYSGQVQYAVMSYGGFLGIGQRYYPMPWRMLDYDTREGGYVVNMTERDLEEAPSFGRDDEPNFDRRYGEHVHSWYGLQY